MIVDILLVKNLFQKQLSLSFEVSHNLIVLSRRDELLELAEDMNTATRIVGIIYVFEDLNLHEKRHELIESCDVVNVDLE